MLGKLLGTNNESDGQDSGHGNSNPIDQENKDVVKTTAIVVPEASIEDENFSEDEGSDGDQAEGTDLGKNLPQVTCGVIVLSKQRCSMTENGVCTSRNDNTLGFTLFAH